MKKIQLHTKILAGLILGVVVGLIFGEKAALIKPVGTIFIRLITMIVVPLVFVSLMIGTASLGDIRKVGRIGLKTFVYFIFTTIIAITLGLTLGNVVRPGDGLEESVKQGLQKNYESSASIKVDLIEEKPSLIDVLVEIVPSNPLKAMAEGNMLQIIFMAIIFGTALTLIKKEKADPILGFLDGVNDAVIQVVHIAMKVAPYGVLALIASVVGQFGVDILLTLLKYALTVIVGLGIHAFIVNSLAVRFLGIIISFSAELAD